MITTECMLHNTVFIICNIGPSRLPRNDVILLKTATIHKVPIKRCNDQFSKFFEGYKYSRILHQVVNFK